MTETVPEDARTTRGAGAILGNHVETDRRLLERPRSSSRFRGTVTLLPSPGPDLDGWRRAAEACPSRAISLGEEGDRVDVGKCIMCGLCQEAAPEVFGMEMGFANPVKKRAELVVARVTKIGPASQGGSIDQIGGQLLGKVKQTLGRSLAIREVDAGSCNGCEVEVTALSNPVYDVERFGVHFVASPRHADVLLVTGVNSRNLELALRRTYEATPDPKVVVAVGACACGGGIFGDTYASGGGVGGAVPVDVYVPGCPPRPESILYGVLLAVDRVRPKS